MRSPQAAAASATVLLSLVTGIALGATGSSLADAVIHFGVGTGFILLATAAFNFGIARWVAWTGALAAGAFGAIFLLQGISDAVPAIGGLHRIAFEMLGHEIERVLPDLTYIWFAAVLLFASTGKSRVMGWVVMGVVIGYEIATAAAVFLGFNLPTVKLLLFAPFVWLLVEALKSGTATRTDAAATRHTVAVPS